MTRTAAPAPSATVLLVDDEAPIRRSLGPYLERGGYRVLLASRIRAVLRRTRGVAQPLTSAARLVAGELLLERTSRRVTLSGREVTLTPKATMLLDYLMCHPGELHTRDDLLASLWGIDFATSTRAVDHRIREIRQALGDDAAHPTYIETVPSVGYRFRAEVRA